MGVMQTHSAYDVTEGGLTELVGANEALDATKYAASVGIAIDTSTAGVSGEIVSVLLASYTTGTGGVPTPAGRLYVFDADPAVAANATALAAAGAEHKTLISTIKIGAGDWGSDANGGAAYVQVAAPFHNVATLYFTFQPDSGAAAINDLAGDDEHIDFNFWFRREK